MCCEPRENIYGWSVLVGNVDLCTTTTTRGNILRRKFMIPKNDILFHSFFGNTVLTSSISRENTDVEKVKAFLRT